MNIEDIINVGNCRNHKKDQSFSSTIVNNKSFPYFSGQTEFTNDWNSANRPRKEERDRPDQILENQQQNKPISTIRMGLMNGEETAPTESDSSTSNKTLDSTRVITNNGDATTETSNGLNHNNSVGKEQSIPTATIQQTSVITLLPKRVEKGRLKYFQRQKSVDEDAAIDMEMTPSSPSSSSSSQSAETTTATTTVTTASAIVTPTTHSTITYNDKNNNNENTPSRTLTEYNVLSLIDNSHHSSTKPKKIPKSSSQQDHQTIINQHFDHRLYQHLSNGYFSKKGKSKSLDMIEVDEGNSSTNCSHGNPMRFLPYSSYEDEQTARYIKDLHISSPAPPSYYGHSSFPNSPCGSPIDSTLLRNSPGSIGPLRRMQQQESSMRYNMAGTSPGSIIPTPQPTFPPNRPIDSPHTISPMTKSRSYDQQQRLYKFAQKKSYSLNTAPYDVYEKNMRRILSEENVPENVLVSKAMNKHYPHLRRASSYDTFNRFSLNGGGGGGGAKSPCRDIYAARQSGKATKIMFPEHDNVTDCNSIFTQPIDDEKIHAMKINRILEKNFPINNNPYTISPCSSLSFDEATDKNVMKKTDHPTMTKSKSLQSQNSTDKNLTIGPYQYNPQIDNEIAVSVSGLLTLPGSNEKKYPITVGELRRRIAPPEFLNKVDMISYVRLAKSSARELLDKHAIRPKHHSRKSKHSVISKMCEAECTELSNGVKTLSEAYFPKEWLANQVISSLQDDEETSRRQKLSEMQNKLEITRSVLKDFSVLLEKSKTHEEMQNYDLATHSFGMSNLNNNIDLILSFLQTQSDAVTNKCASGEIQMSRDEQKMETESGFGSKSSSLDEPSHFS